MNVAGITAQATTSLRQAQGTTASSVQAIQFFLEITLASAC